MEIFQLKGKRIALLGTFSLTSKQGLTVDGAAINWSVESAPVKTNINVLATEINCKNESVQSRKGESLISVRSMRWLITVSTRGLLTNGEWRNGSEKN